MTVLDLATRCIENSDNHLAEVTNNHFSIYLFGYGIARLYHGHGFVASGYDSNQAWSAFRSMIPDLDSYPSHLRYDSYLEVKNSSGIEALREWISVCRGFPVHCETEDLKVPETQTKKESILYVVDNPIRQKRGMYFGNRPDAGCMWTLLSGYLWAERDLGVFPSDEGRVIDSFQPWMEARYPFAVGIPWHRVFRLITMDSDRVSLDYFYSAFDLYRSGGKPNDLGHDASLTAGQIGWGCSEEKKNVLRRIIPE